MTMRITFGRPLLGHVVLKAFHEAASFESQEGVRWTALAFTPQKSGVDNDTRVMGYTATPMFYKKYGPLQRFLRKRDGKWYTIEGAEARFTTQIELEAIPPDEMVTSVLLSIHHEYDYKLNGAVCVATQYDSPHFAKYRSLFERIQKDFISRCAVKYSA